MAQAVAQALEAERIKTSTEKARLQTTIDNLKLQVENKPAGQRGEEGELDLYAELTRQWPTDSITRVKRGERGADVTQIVRDAIHKEAGTIIFERKETKQFQDSFIEQAKRYRTQSETSWVVIVSRTPPSKTQLERCFKNQIAVMEPGQVMQFVSALRELVLVLAKHRLVKTDTDVKTEQLLAYIFGSDFKNRFRDIDTAIERLIENQKKSKIWHEKHWSDESGLYELLEMRRLQIQTALDSIVHGHSTVNGSGERKVPGWEVAGGTGKLAAAN